MIHKLTTFYMYSRMFILCSKGHSFLVYCDMFVKYFVQFVFCWIILIDPGFFYILTNCSLVRQPPAWTSQTCLKFFVQWILLHCISECTFNWCAIPRGKNVRRVCNVRAPGCLTIVILLSLNAKWRFCKEAFSVSTNIIVRCVDI